MGGIGIRVLVACEESQEVCKAFREMGHEAYSCDIQECSGGHPEWHIKEDCLPLINGNCSFVTMGGEKVTIDGKWDLLIAHPPCTRLCCSGLRWLYWGNEEYREKKRQEQKESIDFFLKFTEANCERIAIENPVGIMSSVYRKPDCIYNPYDFKGETGVKKTCLWLKGLPPLIPTQNLPKEQRTQDVLDSRFKGKIYAWNNVETAKLRSKTPTGVARAMAEQWGNVNK